MTHRQWGRLDEAIHPFWEAVILVLLFFSCAFVPKC